MVTLQDFDPHRSLEDARDSDTIAWTAEQNARTRKVLDALPGRAALEARFDELLAIDALGLPVVHGAHTFFTARRGRARQAVLYTRVDGYERALVDPAALDPTGLTALDWWYPSPNGALIAFGLSTNGDERSTLSLLEVASGDRRPEAIPQTRYCSLAWLPDESGFYYTRFPPARDYGARVFRHALGTAWQEDPEIFGDLLAPEDMVDIALSSSGRYLTVRAWSGWARSDVFVADTSAAGPLRFAPLAVGRDAVFDAKPADDTIYVRTNEGAPRFHLFAVDPARLERDAWQEIVKEGAGALDGFALTRAGLVLHTLENVRSTMRLRRHDGAFESLDAFGDGSVLGISANERDETFFVLASSFLEAPAAYRVTAPIRGSATSTVWERVLAPIDPTRYRARQEWFVSKDGTRIPMWVLAGADVRANGTAPAVLYGYGGFDIALTPGFMPTLVPWLDAGGVYAIANLRGGGEFGDAWHRAGMRECKQNVFDDFQAAAEFLGASGIADRSRLAVYGGSNGGLLVAAFLTQCPAGASAVVCAVPLTDMLRYHLFPIGRLWIPEYGDPDRPEDAAFLGAYSPYHNVRDGTAYPATFIETAESDGRVDPMHAKKFAARLQAATSGDAPILLYVEQNAGHGAGKPREKIIAELADRWSFIGWRLGQRLA